jgi:hypothetical protein
VTPSLGWLGAQRIPHLEAVTITVVPYLRDGRGRQDVAGCFPSAKSGIDGVCDAGVLVDDGPAVVQSITFMAPVIGQGDGLELVITEAAT